MASPKPQVPKVLTANRLRDGETVYYTARGDWSPYVTEAKVAATPEEMESLTKVGEGAIKANQVVDVNLVDVNSNGQLRPSHIREVIRATGPTVRLDLNKPVTPAQR